MKVLKFKTFDEKKGINSNMGMGFISKLPSR
jgi:hypothetical protein